MSTIRYISLFSGIEAATVAWHQLGWKPIAYAEIEPFPKAVLRQHYPEVPDLGDMTKVDWKQYHHAADVVVGGSPCQAFSIAGLRKALDDPRGQLMLEYLRACAEIDPEWIVWENVPPECCRLNADGLSGRSLKPWPNSGLMGGRHGECWTLSSSVWPNDANVCSLSSTLETGDVPPRYFLSAKACAGIISRAERRGKALPEELLAALETQIQALET